MKQNKLLNLALKQVHDFPLRSYNHDRFITEDFGFVRSVAGMLDLNGSLLVMGQPYRLKEGRIVHLRSGYVHFRANLHDITLKAHQLLVTPPGSVAQFMECPRIVNCLWLELLIVLWKAGRKKNSYWLICKDGYFFA